MITEISKMQKDDLLFQLKLYRLVPNNQIVRIINERIKDIQVFRQKASQGIVIEATTKTKRNQHFKN